LLQKAQYFFELKKKLEKILKKNNLFRILFYLNAKF